MLKYKMTVPRVQLKYLKCFQLFFFKSPYINWSMQAIHLMFVRVFLQQKNKMLNKFEFRVEMVSSSSMTTCLLPTRSLRCSIEMLFLFLCSLRAKEINHVWEQARPVLGSNLTSEECHYGPLTGPAEYYLSSQLHKPKAVRITFA